MKENLNESIEDILGIPDYVENGFMEFENTVNDFQTKCGYSLDDARNAAQSVFREQINEETY